MLKKLLITILLLLLLTGCSLQSQKAAPPNQPVTTTNEEQSKSITLVIDEKKYELETEDQTLLTAYDVLQRIAIREGLKVKTKQYDLGIFIEGIGDKIGNKNSFWLYYINDKLASVSVDNQQVKAGDTVKFIFSNNNPK